MAFEFFDTRGALRAFEIDGVLPAHGIRLAVRKAVHLKYERVTLILGRCWNLGTKSYAQREGMARVEKQVIKDSLGQIELELENARDARRQLENEMLYNESRGGYEDPTSALSSFLDRAYEILSVVLEAGGLTATRTRLIEQWKLFAKKPGGMGATVHRPEDYLESEPLVYIEAVLTGLRATTGEGPTSEEAIAISNLESILHKTAWLVRRRDITPTGEMQVQGVMHDYLGAFFTDYTRKISFPKVMKTFVPDGGVPDIKAAIEFKYVAAKDEIGEALGGIYEDMAGYSGSADWTRFYTVVYQTDAFVSAESFQKAVSRGGSHVWTAIRVTGSGQRKVKNKKKSKAP